MTGKCKLDRAHLDYPLCSKSFKSVRSAALWLETLASITNICLSTIRVLPPTLTSSKRSGMVLLQSMAKDSKSDEEVEAMEDDTKNKGKRKGGESSESSNKNKRRRWWWKASGIHKKNPELKSLLVLMIKAALRGEQRHRETEGVVFDSFLGPAESMVVLGGRQQSTAYAEQVRGNKGHGMGPPYPYVFTRILSIIVKKAAEKVGERTLLKLKEWEARVEPLPWQEVCEEVLMCKISKTFEKDRRRLTMAIAPNLVEERKALARALEELGWERKYGRAPPSHTERELQDFLTNLVGDKA